MTISLDSLNSNPVGTENGLIVRNIPSGTQDVSIITDGYAISVVEQKDTGRTARTFSASGVNGAGFTETMITLTPTSNFTTGTTGTSFTVTSGKTLRLQSLVFSTNGGAMTCRLRISSSGAVTTSTNMILATSSTSNFTASSIDIPDGLELSGSVQFGLTQQYLSSGNFFDVSLIGFEY